MFMCHFFFEYVIESKIQYELNRLTPCPLIFFCGTRLPECNYFSRISFFGWVTKNQNSLVCPYGIITWFKMNANKSTVSGAAFFLITGAILSTASELKSIFWINPTGYHVSQLCFCAKANTITCILIGLLLQYWNTLI